MSAARFVIASPGHASIYDHEARTLHKHGHLRFIAMGTRRGVDNLPAEVTRLKPVIGLIGYIGAQFLSRFAAESLRFRMHPWFDQWVARQLRPGDHVISSYGYANKCFKLARKNGGKTFVDAGNSHPENFWKILTEEHRRWKSPYPPVARFHYERSLAMMEHVDYVLAASTFVSRTYLERGFKPEAILPHPRPIDLSAFKPPAGLRPKDRPLTVITTGTLCLRKGSPYLFEAIRIVHQKMPDARFVMRNVIGDDVKELLPKYRDLPIKWLPAMPHPELAENLRQADIFILPSLEDGLALTVLEALACGLPVITTPNTGASEFIHPDVNGEGVPICDAKAIADAVFKWSDRILAPGWKSDVSVNRELMTLEHFERVFMGQLAERNLI